MLGQEWEKIAICRVRVEKRNAVLIIISLNYLLRNNPFLSLLGFIVHESRSIFKVLQKKYDQEKLKESSAWKLFALMDKIHKKVEAKPEPKEEYVVVLGSLFCFFV